MHKAYCDEARSGLSLLDAKKKSQIRLNLRLLAENGGIRTHVPD